MVKYGTLWSNVLRFKRYGVHSRNLRGYFCAIQMEYKEYLKLTHRFEQYTHGQIALLMPST